MLCFKIMLSKIRNIFWGFFCSRFRLKSLFVGTSSLLLRFCEKPRANPVVNENALLVSAVQHYEYQSKQKQGLGKLRRNICQGQSNTMMQMQNLTQKITEG